jgi:pSer/pThr/pTyr-binding forkhead associated (FHA) protein
MRALAASSLVFCAVTLLVPMSAPAGPPEEVHLVVEKDSSRTVRVFRYGEAILIGRDGTNNLQLSDAAVSRSHAKLTMFEGDRYLLSDLRSSNGTSLNGKPIDYGVATPVKNGDVVGIGEYQILFTVPGHEPAGPEGLSPSDRQTLFQMTLDLPQLQQYYHLDTRPHRKPLLVPKAEALKGFTQFPELEKFGEPVLFVTVDELQSWKSTGSVFLFTRLTTDCEEVKFPALDCGDATVGFKYAPEGVWGYVVFTRTPDGWKVLDHALLE